MSKFISIRFKKLETINNQTLPIDLSIRAANKVYKLTSIRSLKNGLANFFGEAIQLPYLTKQFTITIKNVCTNQKLIQFFVPKNTVLQFNKKLNVFTLQKQQMKLVLEALIIDDTNSLDYQQGQLINSLSQTSLSDLQYDPPFRINRFMRNQQIIQSGPNSKQKTRNKKSFKLRISDTASQPQKILQRSTDFIKGNYSPIPHRNIKQKNPYQNDQTQKNQQLTSYNYNYDQQKPFHQKLHKKIKSMQFQRDDKFYDLNKNDLRESQKFYNQKLENMGIHQKDNYFQAQFPIHKKQVANQGKTLKRHRSGILENVSLKFLLVTAFVGGISGFAGAKIN